jgi:transcriptional regulator with XRE-family HTH domain
MARTAEQKRKRSPHPLMVFFKLLREELGWSQDQVAEQCGVNQSMISDLEAGVTRYPRLETVAKMALGYRHQIQVHVLNEIGQVVYTWDGSAWPGTSPSDLADCTQLMEGAS